MSTALMEDVIFGKNEKDDEAPAVVSFSSEKKRVQDDRTLTVELLVLAPAVDPSESVHVVGSDEALGGWNSDSSVKMARLASSQWQLILENVPYSAGSIEYKYIIKGEGKDAKVMWEDGSNRRLNLACDFPFVSGGVASKSSSSSSKEGRGSKSASGSDGRSDWLRAGEVFRRRVNYRASGIAIPVFSLRTKEGSGVGEFLDLKKMTDICAKVGSRVIQILPINDTSCFLNWRDSYPYSSLSVFALHPLYLRLQALTKDESILKRIEAAAADLNRHPQIDYEAVMANKNKFIDEIFEKEYLAKNYGSSSKSSDRKSSDKSDHKLSGNKSSDKSDNKSSDNKSSDKSDKSVSAASASASAAASTAASSSHSGSAGGSTSTPAITHAEAVSPRGSVRGMVERINSNSLNGGAVSPRSPSPSGSASSASSGSSSNASPSNEIPSNKTSSSASSSSTKSSSAQANGQSSSDAVLTSQVGSSIALNKFIQKNAQWLVPYAVFVSFSTKFRTTEYSQWPEEYRKPSREQVAQWFAEGMEKVSSGLERTCWVQWQLHEQLLEASRYAASKRVGLKGDLPIGVNRVSVDSWIDSHLFHMEMSTGAPPDQFAEDGQNWGFPTYNWSKMAEDNFAWWRQRLSQMAQYFHAFRIDHILGFFRIWEIPTSHTSGMMGHFNPSIGIHRHELERMGLWDLNRLTQPHIRFDIASSIAGLSTGETVHLLDIISEQGCTDHYNLKDKFKTASGLYEYLETLPQDTDAAKSWKEKFEKTVSALQKNVVLLKDEKDPDLFYPRVNLIKSTSYRDLHPDWRSKLWELYNRYFYGEAQEAFWAQIGAQRLPIIRSATRMLVCGEDLGMVPKCVEPIMTSIGILGLRVQRMPADTNVMFGHPASYAHLTVCTTSSHDTSTVRGWWEEDRAKSAEFFHSILGEPRGHSQPPHFAEPWLIDRILQQHFHSPSMLAIFPIQDFFAAIPELRVQDPASEKINEPANPKHYWRYRIHVTLEDLLNSSSFIGKISDLNAQSGRC